MGSEGQQDIEMAILTALLKGIISTVWVLLHQSNMFSCNIIHNTYTLSLSLPHRFIRIRHERFSS